MLVRDAMTRDPFTIEPSTTLPEATHLMREHGFRRLPVVDHGVLKGIVTDRDLREAGPSTTSALSAWEMTGILNSTRVDSFMRHPVLVTTPDTPLEKAIVLMNAQKIGCLPVLEEGALVGILSESDVFRCFAGLLGARKGCLQVVLRDTPEIRASLEAVLLRAEIRTVAFSSRPPEILLVFEVPGGPADVQVILEEFRKNVAGPVVGWQLADAGVESTPTA